MRVPKQRRAALNDPTSPVSGEPLDQEATATTPGELSEREEYYMLSQWQLIWRRFKAHKLARLGGFVMAIMVIFGLFAEFFAPYLPATRHPDYTLSPPTRIRIRHEGRFTAPFVYHTEQQVDRETFIKTYVPDTDIRYRVRLFARGEPYKLLGFIPMRIHLFGVEEPGVILLFGSDRLGRDMFSRMAHATRVSLSVGLLGIAISFTLGCIFGGISGYYGGGVDLFIQRLIEFLQGIPTLPLWMGIAAAVPKDWSIIGVYFGITVILSLIGWTGLARIVRGKLLELREADFVMAARVAGTSEGKIISQHLLPSFLSYLIVDLTLSIPGMILGETALSFLGIGLRAPAVSWGVLLNDAQNIRTIAFNSWLMIPSVFVIISVLALNFLGDGLRDAADPYKA